MATPHSNAMATAAEFALPGNWTFNGSSVMINVYNGSAQVVQPRADRPGLPPGVAKGDYPQGFTGARPTKIRLLCKAEDASDEKN